MSGRWTGRRPGRASALPWLLTLAALLLAGCGGDAGVSVSDARVRAVIPGQDKTAGYFELRNGTDTTLRLIGASSATVRAIEMHETVQKDGLSRMRRLDAVEIAPGDSVRFEPGGRHLMLFGVESADAGDPPLEMTLQLDGSAPITVKFEVVPIGADIR